MQPTEVISTGSLRLDTALGVGGIPRGCMVEIAGPELSGKTSLCLSILAQAQRLGEQCAFIDADHNLDLAYAKRCGVDTRQTYVSEPAHAEQALDTLQTLAASGALAVIALDSLNRLVPQAELQAALDTAGSAESDQDRIDKLVSNTLQRLSQILQHNHTTVLFTRQNSMRRGPIYHQLAQNPARLALKLHAALRLELLPGPPILRAKHPVGHKIGLKILRNRFSPCRQTTDLDIMHEQGIIITGEIFDLGSQLAIIGKQGTAYEFEGQRLGNNPQETIEFLEKHPDVSLVIEQAIRQRLLRPTPADPPAAASMV